MKKQMLMIVIMMMLLFMSETGNAVAKESKIYNATTLRVIDAYYGCTTKAYFQKLEEYKYNEDVEAFRKAYTAGKLLGIVTWFTKGEVVYLEDATIFTGLIKIRRKGFTKEYWTHSTVCN